MDEHEELEPTVAIPRVSGPPRAAIAEPPASLPLPPQPIPPGATGFAAGRRPYIFGNPFAYALRRLLAFALDFVIVTAVAVMLLYGLIAINPFTGLPNNSEGGFDATVGMGVAIALIVIWICESIFGVTLGKLAFSLHVYVPRHRFVGFGRAFIRNLVRPLDLIVIGWVLAMLPGHRRLGDLLGGTVVAQSPLRAFSPLVGWVLIIALAGLPFIVAGGTVTVLAVATAFIEFIPPLVGRVAHAVLQLFGAAGVRLPTAAG
jgi:uncharacterized RDD family membrane protein YckC